MSMTQQQRKLYKVRKRAQRVSQLIRLNDDTAAHPFNPWMAPEESSAALWVIIQTIIERCQLESLNKYGEVRRRPLNNEDRQKLLEMTTAVVCNVAHSHVMNGNVGVFISRDNTQKDTRYEPDFMNGVLPVVLDRLESKGYLKQVLGHRAKFNPFTGQLIEVSKRTVLTAGETLVKLLGQAKITLADLTYRYERPRKGGTEVEAQEVLLLKDFILDHEEVTHKVLVEYVDDTRTIFVRSQLRCVNSSIWDWDIKQTPWYSGPAIDFKDRQLRRYFTVGFDSGGRLFGGFWQPLSKEQRKDAITINGRLVTELDFSSMAPRILYGLSGQPVPEGDLYAIPGFERSRAAIKVVFNAMMFCTERLKNLPAFDAGKEFHHEELKPVEEVLQAIEAKHPLLKPQFFTGIGHRVQFIESEITLAVLLDLIKKGIHALPVHDSFIVAREDVSVVREVMLRYHREIAKVEGLVHEA